MLPRHQVDNPSVEKAPGQDNAQRVYLEAYRYSLELCENPQIARQVALRFLESMRAKE